MKAHRSKESRELVDAIERAGGTVTITSRGHLKATGPRGIAIVGSASPTGRRGRANAITTLRRYTGLDVTLA